MVIGPEKTPGNTQALFYLGGVLMWISDVLPGNVYDLATAREWCRRSGELNR